MSTRALTISLFLVLLLTASVGGSVAARSARQTAAVMWHPQTLVSGPVDGGTATLVRRSNGLAFRLTTTHLRPGHAYTVWFVVINNPAACSASPCSGPDILLNEETDSQVSYAAGHISGGSGRASFAGSFQAGPIEGWLDGGGLWDPMSAEIQLVLNDHGPKLPAYMPGMTHTYRAGCTDASIPVIFPDSARADGRPGPNACQLYQVAAFTGG